MSLGYVIDYLVRDEIDIKYCVNLFQNELKRNILWWGLPYGQPWLKV